MGKICLSSKPTYPIYSRGFLPTQTPRLAIGGLHAALRAVGLGQHPSFMTSFLKFLTTIQLFSLQTKIPDLLVGRSGDFLWFVLIYSCYAHEDTDFTDETQILENDLMLI